jgi:hypothetical protein
VRSDGFREVLEVGFVDVRWRGWRGR